LAIDGLVALASRDPSPAGPGQSGRGP